MSTFASLLSEIVESLLPTVALAEDEEVSNYFYLVLAKNQRF